MAEALRMRLLAPNGVDDDPAEVQRFDTRASLRWNLDDFIGNAQVDLQTKEAETRVSAALGGIMDEERSTVTVSIDSVEAYAELQFVLEFDGKIYVTAAVIEYDPTDSEMDDDERSDLSELQAMLDGTRLVSGTVIGAPREATSMAQAESRDNL